MGAFRFSIRDLLIFTAFIAAGFAAMLNANSLWASLMTGLVLLVLLTALLAAILRGKRSRPFWIGFTIFGTAYFMLTNWNGLSLQLPTTSALQEIYGQVANVNWAVTPSYPGGGMTYYPIPSPPVLTPYPAYPTTPYQPVVSAPPVVIVEEEEDEVEEWVEEDGASPVDAGAVTQPPTLDPYTTPRVTTDLADLKAEEVEEDDSEMDDAEDGSVDDDGSLQPVAVANTPASAAATYPSPSVAYLPGTTGPSYSPPDYQSFLKIGHSVFTIVFALFGGFLAGLLVVKEKDASD